MERAAVPVSGHFTVWLTTNRSFLPTDRVDVAVMADMLDESVIGRGGKLTEDDWVSVGDPLLCETTAASHDDQWDVIEAAATSTLLLHRWQLDGRWRPVPTGYVASVVRI